MLYANIYYTLNKGDRIMRTRKKSWTEHEFKNNKFIIHNTKDFKGKWNKYFNNNNPLYIEIGCGKGNFITHTSMEENNINFIALERASQIIVTGARKVRLLEEDKKYNGNIGFILGDALNLYEYFDIGEVKRIYLNFSDPWPNKKKWAKRRLTHRSFLNIYKDILSKDGEIHFKTDNTELFEFSLNEFAHESWKMKNISLDLHNSNYHKNGYNIMTEYEEKFSSKGLKIYRLEASL